MLSVECFLPRLGLPLRGGSSYDARVQHVDLKFTTPAELLAADEAWLDWCEAGQGDELLMFWEPQQVFVVLGYANQVAAEVNTAACAANNVPIHRRCTGGGTVVQMPGGLNYSLILRISEHGPTRNISATNGYVMGKNCDAIQAAVKDQNLGVTVQGHTDLAVTTPNAASGTFLKVAGNSQRRRKHFLLFHGTFLLDCNLDLISELLRTPSLEPEYRANRPHSEFVTNLKVSAASVKEALLPAWGAQAGLENLPLKEIESLAREKYAVRAWNYKF
jgi:lipoate-protein ligase A